MISGFYSATPVMSTMAKPSLCASRGNSLSGRASICSSPIGFSRGRSFVVSSAMKDNLYLGAFSSSWLRLDSGNLMPTSSFLIRRHAGTIRPPHAPRAASDDVPLSFRYPPMTKKPGWWWRILASIPYLLPLHEAWVYSETTYNLHPFFEIIEALTHPFLIAVAKLPDWFLMAYFFVGYLGVVRRKEWPHFFRFHLVMGMLLEIALQVVGVIHRGMPFFVYWGKLGMHFWTAVSFAYFFTVLTCMGCAMCGMYADVPFAADAAYMQMPYD